MPYALYIFENGYIPEGLGSFIYQQKVVLVVHGVARALEILLKQDPRPDSPILSFHGTNKNTLKTIEDLATHLEKGEEVLVIAGHHSYAGKFVKPPTTVKMPVELLNSDSSKELREYLEANSIPPHNPHKKSTNLDAVLRRHYKKL